METKYKRRNYIYQNLFKLLLVYTNNSLSTDDLDK